MTDGPVLYLGSSTKLSTLISMGYPEDLANRALTATKHASVEAAIDWLDSLPDGGKGLSNSVSFGEKRMKLNDEMSEADKKQLEWERQRAQREAIRIQKEREEAREHERRVKLQLEEVRKKREDSEKNPTIVSPQIQAQLDQKRDDERAAALYAKERREAKEHAESVKRHLVEDQKRREQLASGTSSIPQITPTPAPIPTPAPQPQKQYSECLLQLRLPTGQPIKEQFLASESLLEVHNYVASLLEPGFNFLLFTPHPKREFGSDELFKSLQELGLAPRAILQVLETENRGEIKFSSPKETHFSPEKPTPAKKEPKRKIPERKKEDTVRLPKEGEELFCQLCHATVESDAQIKRISCGDEFHLDCIDFCLSHDRVCPVCNKGV